MGVGGCGHGGHCRGGELGQPTPYPENNFHTRNIEQFARDVKAATGGALEIRAHSNQSLFKHPEIKNAVRGAQVPIGEVLISGLGNENPVFEADSVPFLATDYDAAQVLWRAQRPAVEEILDAEGLMVLFAVPWPPQGLYAKKPIERVEDLQGVKFRAYNAATERLAQLASAVPTQVEAAEVAQAFATGRVDAMMTSPSTGTDSKAWDFVSNYYGADVLMARLGLFVASAIGCGMALRRLAGPARLARGAATIDGFAVVLLVVFAVAIMDDVGARLIADPAHVL